MLKFFLNKRAVSPVIGTILMVAVTVVMAAIIGGFVYQMGRPQQVPNLATSLLDDVRVILTSGADNNRVAKLTIESGDVIAQNELIVVATYTGEDDEELTVTLDGADLVAGTAVAMGAGNIEVTWIDSDGSVDLSPGDRLDFTEAGAGAGPDEVTPNTDFTVKITHKSSKSTIANHTIKVY